MAFTHLKLLKKPYFWKLNWNPNFEIIFNDNFKTGTHNLHQERAHIHLLHLMLYCIYNLKYIMQLIEVSLMSTLQFWPSNTT